MHPLSVNGMGYTLGLNMFGGNVSYSQTGEDRILFFLFKNMLKKDSITYMDIGANDPVRFSNTYLLYRSYNKKKGVLVDANPDCVKKLSMKRKEDVCLNYGLSKNGGEVLKFYRFNSDTLNTFSEEDVDEILKKGYKLRDTVEVPTISINELYDDYFSDGDLDFLSIDIEGMDIDVIQSIEFKRWKPRVICIESIEFKNGIKREDYNQIKEYLDEKGYIMFADTWINTVFVRKEVIDEYYRIYNEPRDISDNRGVFKMVIKSLRRLIKTKY